MTSQELKEWRERKIKEYDEDRLIARQVITKHFETLTEIAEQLAKVKDMKPQAIETPFGLFVFHKTIL